MNKKIITVILSILVLIVVGFSIFASYLNKPEIIVARALSNKNALKIDGNSEINVNFDPSKLMQNAEIASNPFAELQVQAIKSALEASSLKVSFNGTAGSDKFKFDGNVSLPQMLGSSTTFSVYAEKGAAWFKQGSEAWVKSDFNTAGSSSKDGKANEKALLKFLKGCPVSKNGDIITVTMHPKYDDIKNILSKEELSSLNDAAKGQLTLEQLFNILDIQVVLDIKKNSRLFIPNPYVSEVNAAIKGDLSKLSGTSLNIPEESKSVIEGLSFTANAAGNFKKASPTSIEKPADIK